MAHDGGGVRLEHRLDGHEVVDEGAELVGERRTLGGHPGVQLAPALLAEARREPVVDRLVARRTGPVQAGEGATHGHRVEPAGRGPQVDPLEDAHGRALDNRRDGAVGRPHDPGRQHALRACGVAEVGVTGGRLEVGPGEPLLDRVPARVGLEAPDLAELAPGGGAREPCDPGQPVGAGHGPGCVGGEHARPRASGRRAHGSPRPGAP